MSTASTLVIKVPQGQGCIQNFTLEPSLPDGDVAGEWKFSQIDENGNCQDADDFSVVFDKKSSWLQKQSELCVLVVTMNKPGWRFAMEGTKSCKNEENTADVLHDVRTEIGGNGKVLKAYIQSLGNLDETVGFSFVAAHVSENGTTTIYQSPDPKGNIQR